MEKLDQILLKKKILNETFNSFTSSCPRGIHNYYPIKIGRETFELIGTTEEGHLMADRDVPLGAKQAKTGSFVVIKALPFYVLNGETRMVILKLLCAIIPNENDVEISFLFDKDLNQIEKEFILEDYPKDSKVEINGTIFMVTKNTNKEISLIPIESDIWYKSSKDGSKRRFIEDGKIVEQTLR